MCNAAVNVERGATADPFHTVPSIGGKKRGNGGKREKD